MNQNSQAMTKAEWLQKTEGRQRPITDRFMSNAKATRLRAEQSTSVASPLDAIMDAVQASADRVVPLADVPELQPDPTARELRARKRRAA